MIYMLRITADVPSAILLNGQPAGELLQEKELCLPIGSGKVLLQAFPLRKGFLPASGVMEIAGAESHLSATEAIKLYLLHGGTQLHAAICFEQIFSTAPSMPYLLRRTSVENPSVRASVYFDRTFNFAIESSGEILLCGAFDETLTSAEILRRGNTLIFQGIHAQGIEFFAVALGSAPAVLLHKNVNKLSVSDQLMEYTVTLGCGVFCREKYLLREQHIASRELYRENADPLAALLIAIREKEQDFAMSLLAPALRKDVDFVSLCDFAGDFCDFYAEARGTLGLCYENSPGVYAVRLLRAEIKNEQIANITEME